MSRYFCHSCQEEVDGNTLESGDIECFQCSGVFLELLGQDIESFIGNNNNNQTIDDINSGNGNSNNNNGSLDSNSSQTDNDQNNINNNSNNVTSLLLPGILSQILGGSLNSPTSLTYLSSSGNGNGNGNDSSDGNGQRPIGLIVRQTAIPGDDLLSALLGRSLLQRGIGGGGNGNGSGIGGIGGGTFEDLLHHIMMNESSYANHGASEEAIARLERRTDNLHELGECSISQETFTENDTAIILSCHHAFKENEILQWLRVNKTCPVCRVPIE